MDIKELSIRAIDGRGKGDFSFAYQLSSLLYRLKVLCQDKFLITDPDYFESLGCAIKRSDVRFKDDENNISIELRKPWLSNRAGRAYRSDPIWQLKIPVDVANKILTLGLP